MRKPVTQPGGTALVVGAGLIGTSAALALKAAGWEVWLEDRSPHVANLAAELGAGIAALPEEDPDVVLVSVPPAAAAQVIHALQSHYLESTFSDTSSVKSNIEVDVERLGVDQARFVGGHPMAGSERPGPASARADLFEGRPWVLTRHERTTDAALARILHMVRACGAVPVLLDAQFHDRAVALVSHVPQVVASLTAARLFDAEPGSLELAGQGLRDMTRIADSDPGLWTEILAANAGPVLEVLDRIGADLEAVRAELRARQQSPPGEVPLTRGSSRALPTTGDSQALPLIAELMERGARGRARLPGKHGAAPTVFTIVPVIVADRPGELARLLVAAGEANVNVEDVSIEHSSGQPVGLIALSVRPEAADQLRSALRSRGWSVHG